MSAREEIYRLLADARDMAVGAFVGRNTDSDTLVAIACAARRIVTAQADEGMWKLYGVLGSDDLRGLRCVVAPCDALVVAAGKVPLRWNFMGTILPYLGTV